MRKRHKLTTPASAVLATSHVAAGAVEASTDGNPMHVALTPLDPAPAAATAAFMPLHTLPPEAKLWQCRRGCPKVFANASNRSRHEKKQHAVDHAPISGDKRPREFVSLEGEGEEEEDNEEGALRGNVMCASSMPAASLPSAGVDMTNLLNLSMDLGSTDAAVGTGDAGLTATPKSESTTLQHIGAAATVQPETNSRDAPASGHLPNPLALRDDQLQACCLPFLQWLCTSPLTAVEALVKARRISHIKQLQPVKLNLRFIFLLLLDGATGRASQEMELVTLTLLPTCQTLAAKLDQRQVGEARIYAIFLLVKKVLTYLASCEGAARRQFLTPNIYASYTYVDAICSESGQRRKQEARNRALLGKHGSTALQKAHRFQASHVTAAGGMPASAFQMPSISHSVTTVRQLPASPPYTASAAAAGPARATIPAAAVATAATTTPPHEEADRASPNELTEDELTAVAQGSLAYVQQRGEDRSLFVPHLVTATLCLAMAPRSQVLRELKIGSSFVKKADGRYWVQMLAELNKNGKPTLFPLPMELTRPYDYYLESVRPRLLGDIRHDYVFCKQNGTAPRADFGSLTALSTQQLLGRPVNPHAFRSAVVTTYYSRAHATNSDMLTLASIMAHEPATARNYYFRPQMAQAGLSTSDRLCQALQIVGDASKGVVRDGAASTPNPPGSACVVNAMDSAHSNGNSEGQDAFTTHCAVQQEAAASVAVSPSGLRSPRLWASEVECVGEDDRASRGTVLCAVLPQQIANEVRGGLQATHRAECAGTISECPLRQGPQHTERQPWWRLQQWQWAARGGPSSPAG
jgi:hypothetical protein